MRFNIGKFLEKRRAIMSYIYDAFGFKRGVIIATPGDEKNQQPYIGYAFFDEVVPRIITEDRDGRVRVYNEKFCGSILDIPLYRDTFKKHGLDILDSEVRRLPDMIFDTVDYPYHRDARLDDDKDYLKECVLLAFERANGNADNYYVTDDLTDIQSSSELIDKLDRHSPSGYIKLKICNPIFMKESIKENHLDEVLSDTIIRADHVAAIRQKIRSFEYRACRYYRYIEGHKTKEAKAETSKKTVAKKVGSARYTDNVRLTIMRG